MPLGRLCAGRELAGGNSSPDGVTFDVMPTWPHGQTPSWWMQMNMEQREIYAADLDVIRNHEIALYRARTEHSGPICTGCHQPAPTVDRDERCSFCQLTRFLYLASGNEIAGFIRSGAAKL